MSERQRLPASVVLTMLVLCLAWGANMVAIKATVGEMGPFFAAALRSAGAALCVHLLMRFKGISIFPSRTIFLHGAVVGTLFGLEFACIYLGMKFTLATRTSVLLYTHPFFVAAGAHLWLKNDRMHGRKLAGLFLAFAGIFLLFAKDWGPASLATLPGDLLILAGAAGWAATTLYIKRYLAGTAHPLLTLFYQLAFSAPLLAVFWLTLEGGALPRLSALGALSLGYQTFLVAFVSYAVWFTLITRHSVSLLAAFTCFTPIFGVLLSWLMLPGETLRPALVVSLALVCGGMVLVNSPKKA